MDDLISRQSALDALDKHFESFIKRFGYDSYERADEKTKLVCDGLSEAEDVIMGLPSATDTNVGTKLGTNLAEVGTDCISRQAAIEEWKNDFKGYVNALNIPRDDYNGIMEYIDELPSEQPELAIPLSWIEGQIKWLKSLDNAFSTLTAGQISAMVNKWKDEQDEIDKPDEKN